MNPTALPCPRCHVPLYVGGAAGATVHACGGCGGVWLDSASARRIAEHLPPDAIRLAQVASHHARHGVDTASAAHCPVCTRPMTRTPVAMARVEIDVCGAHGTWYDRHELEAIAQAMAQTRWRASAPAPPQGYPPQPQGHSPHQQQQSHFQDAATGVAVAVGTEAAAEGAFWIVGSILEAIWD